MQVNHASTPIRGASAVKLRDATSRSRAAQTMHFKQAVAFQFLIMSKVEWLGKHFGVLIAIETGFAGGIIAFVSDHPAENLPRS
jgi:hypothetical protein